MKIDTIINIGVCVLLFASFAALLIATGNKQQESRREDLASAKFVGACEFAGGKVEGNLCIKNNTVILRKGK